MIGNYTLGAVPDKTQAICDSPRPGTKTQVRALIGLAGFYRKCVPNLQLQCRWQI